MLTMMICFQLMQLKQDSSYSQVLICFSHFLTPHRFLHVSTYFICFLNSCNHGLHRRGHAGIHATHEIHTMLYFGAYPCPWSRKIDMCGVLGNWVCGQELGRGQPGHASPVTIWPTCVTTATRLLRIFGIFETLGYSGYYSQVTMLVLIWFE